MELFLEPIRRLPSKLTAIDRPDHTDKIHKYLVCFETSLILKDSARHTNMAMIVAH